MILVTGAAGFIGYHTALRLLNEGHRVLGLDNLNDYYDPSLKQSRLDRLSGHQAFSFVRCDISQAAQLGDIFMAHDISAVVHLAAQAGVRYSIENPLAYVSSNLVGFVNLIDLCRKSGIRHFVYASTSSVYGSNEKLPFSEGDAVDHPLTIYAATKRSNELIAHSYSHLFNLPTTGLRFFTVYGPWGRPDMALFKFVRAVLDGTEVELYNHGEMLRDFTYVDDIVAGIVGVLERAPSGFPDRHDLNATPHQSSAPFRVLNIGGGAPVSLIDFIRVIEQALNKKAKVVMRPLQPGDVRATIADATEIQAVTGRSPMTPIDQGVREFVRWYLSYYQSGSSLSTLGQDQVV
jgi:UDP-glucuronate 4-epimerase